MSDLLGITDNKALAIFIVVFFRYLLLASIAYLVFYVARRKSWSWKKIQARFPEGATTGGISVLGINLHYFAILGYLFFFGPGKLHHGVP